MGIEPTYKATCEPVSYHLNEQRIKVTQLLVIETPSLSGGWVDIANYVTLQGVRRKPLP